MNDPELNKAIAGLDGYNINDRYCVQYPNDSAVYFLSESSEGRKVDYVNNWNDLMPLVVEYGICFEFHNGKFDHCYAVDEQSGAALYWTDGESPQRALAECLLKVLETKGDK